jgi:hypothetical protein
MDPVTGLAAAAAAVGVAGASTSREVVLKILGPTADYLGDELLQWAQHRRENVGRIINNAEERLGDRINEEGRVPPKVLKEILTDGSFAEDQIEVEYFGGVLASSRSGIDRDDRGAAFAKLVSQLTVYQLRSHFFCYQLFKDIHNGASYNITDAESLGQMEIFIPYHSYVTALEFVPKEDASQILAHTMFGLSRLDLISDDCRWGSAEHIKAEWAGANEQGILVAPSALGVELFHWAHGLGNTSINRFLDEALEFRSEVVITTTPGSVSTKTKDVMTAQG